MASGAAEGMTLDEYVEAVKVALPLDEGAGPPSPTVMVLPEDPGLRNYEKQGVVDTSKAERELGFVPTPLATFMDAVVAWHAPLLSDAEES